MYRRCGFRYERKLRAIGVIRIAGIDEAGRGALAGPVVAAVAVLPEKFRHRKLNDSKQLAPASSTCMPDQPARSSLSEISASSVMPHSSQPPSSSRATLLIRPMVPAKIAPSRSFLEGWETAKKYS